MLAETHVGNVLFSRSSVRVLGVPIASIFASSSAIRCATLFIARIPPCGRSGMLGTSPLGTSRLAGFASLSESPSAAFTSALLRCVYRDSIREFVVQPSIRLMIVSCTPRRSRSVARLCRKMCACMFFPIPARFEASFRILLAPSGVRRPGSDRLTMNEGNSGLGR